MFRGLITRIFFGLDLPSSYYGPAMKILKEMGCLRVIVQGAGRYAESEVVLYHPPNEERYATAAKQLDENMVQRRARMLKAGER